MKIIYSENTSLLEDQLLVIQDARNEKIKGYLILKGKIKEVPLIVSDVVLKHENNEYGQNFTQETLKDYWLYQYVSNSYFAIGEWGKKCKDNDILINN